MARYTGPRFKLCRREGVNLFGNVKFDVEKRDYPPGDHGLSGKRGKLSDYGIQLREKQKVKRIYGIMEKQFRRYYEKAARTKKVTGTVLLQFLERRLDNVVFRLGFASTRPAARQLVSHGKVLVNRKKVNISSFLVTVEDEIVLNIPEKRLGYIKEYMETTKDRVVPEWLSVDIKELTGKVVKMPERDDVMFDINEQLIVELYSK